jgi:hypothetical protein
MTATPPAPDPAVIDQRSGTRVDSATDPAVMGEVFRRLLQTPERDIVGCRIARYRHRPGERCLVQYAISVRDGAGVVTDEHVTGQWHLAPDRTPALYRKLARRAAAEGDAPWTSPFAPVFFDAASGMLATTWPWDRRLPTLPRITTGRARSLAPMLAWMDAASGDLEGVRVERVRYREQLNAVVRYDVRVRRAGGRTEAARFFVKAYTDAGGARAAGLLAMLDAATPPASGAARVRRAVGDVDACRALVLAEAPGTPLDRLPMDPRVIEPALRHVATGSPARRTARTSRRALGRRPPHRRRPRAPASPRRCRTCGRRSTPSTRSSTRRRSMHRPASRMAISSSSTCPRPRRGAPLSTWIRAVWPIRGIRAARRAGGPRATPSGASGRWRLGLRRARGVLSARVPARNAAHLPVLQAMACIDVAAGLVKRRDPAWIDRAGRLVARARTFAEAPR